MGWAHSISSYMESFSSSVAQGVNATSDFLTNSFETYIFMYEKKIISPLLLQTLVATFGAILIGYFCGKVYFWKYDAKQSDNKNITSVNKSSTGTSKVKRKCHKSRSNKKIEQLEKSATDSEVNMEEDGGAPLVDPFATKEAKQADDGSDNLASDSDDEVGTEDVILDPNDINYVEDGGAPMEDMNVDFIVQNIQAKVKAAESRSLWKKISKDMSEDDRMAEQEAQHKQLENIFALMESQKEKFGVDGVGDVEQQMKLYM